jgi:hypothetical protein
MSSDPTANEIRRQTRSLLLATVASVASIALSVQFVGAEWFPQHPITHPIIATAVSTATFWATWPRRSVLTLCVFVPMAFGTITVVSMLVGIALLMPS